MARALHNSASLALDRNCIYPNPESLEEAIYRHREFLRIPSSDDALYRRYFIEELESLMRTRSRNIGVSIEGLSGIHSLDAEVTSFPHLIASLRARSTTDETDWWSVPEERVNHLRALKFVCRTKDILEIGEAIEYCQVLLAASR